MTPTQYRQSRLSLHLSQSTLAMQLGVSRECVNRREAGHPRNPITKEAALAMLALGMKLKTK